MYAFKNGQTSVILRVKLLDSSKTDGSGLTGLTNVSSGLIISTVADNEASATAYTAAGSTIDTISTLGTYAAPTAGHCRFKEVDSTNHKGLYEIQLADARFGVSGAKSLIVSVSGATNLAQGDIHIPLQTLDPYDLSALGVINTGTAAAIASGSLTLQSGHGITNTASILVFLTGGTNARGKSRIATYSGTGDVFNVDPAWNANGETTPSGSITYVAVPLPLAAQATPFPANITQWNGTAVPTPDTAGYPKVTVKSGAGTGEINLSAGIVPADIKRVNAVTVNGDGNTTKWGP